MNTDKQPQMVYVKIDYSDTIYGDDIPEYVLSNHSDKSVSPHHLKELKSVYIFTPKELEALLQKERREADQWISVKDKLPEIDIDDPWNKEFCQSKGVWTYSSFGMRQGRYIHRGEYSTWIVDGASSSNGINVTHWMPLPQPPKQ